VPELTLEGTAGTYILKSKGRVSEAIFKPRDEEAGAPNNPRGQTGRFGGPSSRKGVRAGEACFREAAAFMIDHGRFSGVPETYLATILHPKFHISTTSSLMDSSR
jgi:hypothetical protein